MVATDELEQNTTMYFVADALRPYLKKVEIIDPDNITKYSKAWTLEEDNNLECLKPTIDKALGNETYTIKLEFSEPVIYPVLIIDTLGRLKDISSEEPIGKQKNFTATLNVNDKIEDGERVMVVYAEDLTGNKLLALEEETTIDPATELTRDSAGIMQGIGGYKRVGNTAYL